jgi:hypothetical protein
MNSKSIFISILFLMMTVSCIVQFSPDSEQNIDQLVVEGMITDMNRVNRIKLSRSVKIGVPLVPKTVKGATVTITDESGIVTKLTEYPTVLIQPIQLSSGDK